MNTKSENIQDKEAGNKKPAYCPSCHSENVGGSFLLRMSRCNNCSNKWAWDYEKI